MASLSSSFLFGQGFLGNPSPFPHAIFPVTSQPPTQSVLFKREPRTTPSMWHTSPADGTNWERKAL